MVFYGEHQVTITSGGRIALPKKIREILSDQNIVITKGFGTCLAGYDKKDWEKRAETLLDVSLLEKDEIGKRRMLFSSTIYLEIDEQGRIVLPKSLRVFAGLEKKATINGVGDHFEIWNPASWDSYIKEIDK